jgi:hypothetical protein
MARQTPEQAGLLIRPARPRDAAAMGRLYVAAWREAYPSLLPMPVLLSMSESRAARQFQSMIGEARESVLVADLRGQRVVGLATGGRALDRGLELGETHAQGEVFTLYVDPMVTQGGVGRRLLAEMLRSLAELGHQNAVVWVLKGNPARFFYEHMGAKLVAVKREQRFGTRIELEAYAWPDLARVMMRRGAN